MGIAFFQKSNNQSFAYLRKGKGVTAPRIRLINTAAGRNRMFHRMIDGRTAVLIKIPSYGTFCTFIPVKVFNAVRHSAFDWVIPIYVEGMTTAQRYAQTLQCHIVLAGGTLGNPTRHITCFDIAVVAGRRELMIVIIDADTDVAFPRCMATGGHLHGMPAGLQYPGTGSRIILLLSVVRGTFRTEVARV